VLKELTELKFLDPSNTAAIGRYEGMLKFISDKNGVTRAEIDAYYRDGIRSLIADTVDEAFNKIGEFLLENAVTNPVRDHRSVLTRNAKTGEYTLRYGGAYTNNEYREITAPSFEALQAEMRRRNIDFDQTGVNNVAAERDADMPGVVYADWKNKGGIDALGLLKETLFNFYVDPSRDNGSALLGIYSRYMENGGLVDIGSFVYTAQSAFLASVYALSPETAQKILSDARGKTLQLSRLPNDPRFEVFSRQR